MRQILPLTSDPNQTFQSTLTVDGKNITLGFKIIFNEVAGYWIMMILNPSTNVIILDSIPLLPSMNILGQYSYLRIGSAYLINASHTQAEYPTDANLGTDFVLVWGDTVL